MNRVLLVNLPMYDTVAPPGALAILASICEQNHRDYEFFDFNLLLVRDLAEDEFTELSNWLSGITLSYDDLSKPLTNKVFDLWCQHIKSYQLDDFEFIAISVFSTWSLRMVQLVLPWLRQHTDTKIVLGGNGCSSKFFDTDTEFSVWIKQNNLADFLVIGDGEPTFDAILKGETEIPGVNQVPQKIDWDINSYPIPSYKKFDLDLYGDPTKVYITGSRGCVRECTFCEINTIWPKYRFRRAEYLVEEIKIYHRDLGATTFDFTDSLINGSISNFNRFNCLLAEEKQKDPTLADIGYMGQFICRPRTQMPPAHYEAMYYAGCRQITVGIESLSEKVRHHMKKKFDNADIDYHLEQCSRWNIKNVWLMLSGYPTETREDHEENLRYLEKYAKYAQQGVIELIRWGTTMHLIDDTPITSADMLKELDIMMDAGFTIEIRSNYNWVSGKNPTLDLAERIRRRLELHEYSVRLGYPQPRLRQELSRLLTLVTQHFASPPRRVFEIAQA